MTKTTDAVPEIVTFYVINRDRTTLKTEPVSIAIPTGDKGTPTNGAGDIVHSRSRILQMSGGIYTTSDPDEIAILDNFSAGRKRIELPSGFTMTVGSGSLGFYTSRTAPNTEVTANTVVREVEKEVVPVYLIDALKMSDLRKFADKQGIPYKKDASEEELRQIIKTSEFVAK